MSYYLQILIQRLAYHQCYASFTCYHLSLIYIASHPFFLLGAKIKDEVGDESKP